MTDNMGKTKEETFLFFFLKNLNSPLSRVYTTKETEGEKQNLRRRSGRNCNFRKRLTLFQNEPPYHPLQVVGGAFCSPIKTSAETHSVVLRTSPTPIFPLPIFLIISLEAGEICCKMIYSINLNASGPSL